MPVRKFTNILFLALMLAGWLPPAASAQSSPVTPAIACGPQSCYALQADGAVWAWGADGFGQLGNGRNLDSSLPVQVSGLTDVTSIAAANSGGYALKADGTVWAWGHNANGQLGNGSNSDSNLPVQVKGLSGVTAIAAGSDSGYALKGDGSIWAWGANDSGQLGDGLSFYGTMQDTNIPTLVRNLKNIKSIGAHDSFAYAIDNSGNVWTWGAAVYYGATHGVAEPIPVQVAPDAFSGVTRIAFSYSRGVALAFYAIKNDGTLWAWGSDGHAQLGDGLTIDETIPVQVPVSKVTAVVGSFFTGYAITNNGVNDWGDDTYGQIGNYGDYGYAANSLTGPNNLSNVIALAATGASAYALEANGTVWVWGTTDFVHKNPVQIPGLSGVTAITCPTTDCYATEADGSLWAWGGDNSTGQLGNGTTAPSVSNGFPFYQATPTQIHGPNLSPAPVVNPSPQTVTLLIGSTTAQVGTQKQIMPVPATLNSGRVYVPLRFISQAMGSQVSWNSASKAATITTNTTTVVMTEALSLYTINGQLASMDATPFVSSNGATMVPVRFLAQALGYQVTWDGAARQVTITPQP